MATAAASVAALRRARSAKKKTEKDLFELQIPTEAEWICQHDVHMLMLDGQVVPPSTSIMFAEACLLGTELGMLGLSCVRKIPSISHGRLN